MKRALSEARTSGRREACPTAQAGSLRCGLTGWKPVLPRRLDACATVTGWKPVLIALVWGAVGSCARAQSGASYANPVLAGDYPDPSVIRVGKDFWATATSSEWGPQFPILHSTDLVNWEVVGAVF